MAEIQQVYPRLVVSDGAAAIDFYRRALGAIETVRYTDPSGKIVHAELTVGPAAVAIKDEDAADPARLRSAVRRRVAFARR